jgi:hypothetical protein
MAGEARRGRRPQLARETAAEMISTPKGEHPMPEGIPPTEKVQEILSLVAEKVPPLIQGLINTVFSEQAGRSVGKAAVAFYTELKSGGIPEQTALEMTRDYINSFTKLGEMLKHGTS